MNLAPQTTQFLIAEADPQGAVVLALLRQAAIEARAMYPELHAKDAPWPSNGPTPPRGIYLVATLDGLAVGMAAHRPMNRFASEVRRMYVHRDFRRRGIALALLAQLESHARAHGFTHLRLETGNRQAPAMRLYASCGFLRIAPFGSHASDPTSVCCEKPLTQGAQSRLVSHKAA